MNYKPIFKIIKLLEENLYDLGLSKLFLDGTPKVESTKEVDRLEFIKIKYLCSAKLFRE